MNYSRLILDGIACIGMMTMMMIVISASYPRYALKFLPKDVQEKCTLEPLSASKARFATLLYALCGCLFIAYLVFLGIAAYGVGETAYPILFLHYFIVLTFVHVYDVFILDWLLISKITPKFLFKLFPGTENCKGYKEFGFNKMEHFKNFVGTGIGSLVLAGVEYGILYWFIW